MIDLMKAIPTPNGAKVFAELLQLKATEQEWVLHQYCETLDSSQVAKMQELLERSCSTQTDLVSGVYNDAKERLLEDADLSAREKVLLTGLMLFELHEIEEFHGRQVTETLRDVSNPVNNITAALTGLISKGEAEIVDQGPAAKNVHKRYRLTREGMFAANEIAKRKLQGRPKR